MFRILLIICGFSISQMIGSAQTERQNIQSHQIHIHKSTDKIVLDGQHLETSWQEADLATEFWEKSPRDGIHATMITEAKLTYDDQFLYVAITCFDTSQQHVISTLKRDSYWEAEGVAIVLDPINEASNGLAFGCNPKGVQTDSWLGGSSGDGNWNDDWDNIWFAETHQYSDRWTVEMAIPFKTLRFEASNMRWGLNFFRRSAKKNEIHTWAPIPLQFWPIDLGYAGQLIWDQAPPVAKGNVALIPYISGGIDSDFETDSGVPDKGSVFSAGMDAKVALSSALNLDLTINPDFSQVEVDQQVTNLTRFNIFLPERRNFFLENSDLFGGFGNPLTRPFFSRRIGLDEDGRAVPIFFGARLSGNVNDNLRIGVLDMQSKRTNDQEAQNYFSGVFSHRVLKRSVIKGMFVNRQGFTENEGLNKSDYGRNASLGFDYSNVQGSVIGWANYDRSFKPGINKDAHFASAGGGYSGRILSAFIDIGSTGTNHFTDIGYDNRIDNYDAERDTTIRQGYNYIFLPVNLRFVPQNSDQIQSWELNTENIVFFNPDMSFNEMSLNFSASIQFTNTSSIFIGSQVASVELAFPFSFTDEEPLPKGRYDYKDIQVSYNSDERKLFNYRIGLQSGGLFNGKRRQVSLRLNYRRQPWGVFGIRGEYNTLQFPTPYGETELWLIGPRMEISFSRNIFWTTFLQYNTQADNFNVNSRFQWQFRPLSSIFLVYTDNYAVENWGPKTRALVFKVNYWLTL